MITNTHAARHSRGLLMHLTSPIDRLRLSAIGRVLVNVCFRRFQAGALVADLLQHGCPGAAVIPQTPKTISLSRAKLRAAGNAAGEMATI